MKLRRELPLLLALFALGCGSDDSGATPGTGGSGASGGSGGASGGSGGASGGSGGTAGSTQAGDATFTPGAIGLDADDVTNPLRGQYLWLGTPAYPSGWTDVDSYERYNWDRIESSAGNYDWSVIDDPIAEAKQRKGRFGMRVMALCQGCPGHTYQGAGSSIPDDLAASANSLIATAPGETQKYVIPDWNSQAYLDRLEALVEAIAARYHDDPTFAFVDVFSYGNWGEFHLYPFNQPGGPYDSSSQQPISDANAKLIVQRAAAAFDNKLLVLNSENKAALAEAVGTASPPIGIRVDCLGSDGLAGGSTLDTVPGASERWRTAPFITEWCQHNLGSSGANLFVQGEQQVRDYHVSMLSSGNFQSDPSSQAEVDAFRKANVEAGYRLRTASVTVHLDASGSIHVTSQWLNDGVAPTYLPWQVVIGVRGPSNAEATMTLDLRKIMPDAPLDDDETLTASGPLSPGDYEVYFRVEDTQGVSPPMQLAMDGKNADGEYVLGSMTLK
jgi:Domain of unknown function (DUF4832)